MTALTVDAVEAVHHDRPVGVVRRLDRPVGPAPEGLAFPPFEVHTGAGPAMSTTAPVGA